MIRLINEPVVLLKGAILSAAEAEALDIDWAAARRGTIAARILAAHNQRTDRYDGSCNGAYPGGRQPVGKPAGRGYADGGTPGGEAAMLRLRFDALASHDITYVGIVQTARAGGLREFPMPYVLTNCHNSLCAVGGTVNADDHVFGLSAARRYGGIFVPPHLAVIHQYVRETMTVCGGMILGSDSHTRYGALGVMGIGEGGPELVKQLLGKTYDLPPPRVVGVLLEGAPGPGVGPQDVALALIGAVFANGFVKNSVMEFFGPGLAGLSVEYRCGIDVMSTETACLSSVWATDDAVRAYLALHGRAGDFAPLAPEAGAAYDGLIRVDLGGIEPMIALPFHPGNIRTIAEMNSEPRDILRLVEREAEELFGRGRLKLDLCGKVRDNCLRADQGVIAGCAGGSFENIVAAAAIVDGGGAGGPDFNLAVYPASAPQSLALMRCGAAATLTAAGAILRSAFCGPCFGAGDTPADGALSLRHTTRNFPNREGSSPAGGQLAAVALMDARSIAATAAAGGRLTSAAELDWKRLESRVRPDYSFDKGIYERRVYNGFRAPKPDRALVLGPNIADWPPMPPLPEHLILRIASVITDPVTTTDELIPSGETSSMRSNPLKLAEFALSRKDPGYVGRAKAVAALEQRRRENPSDPEVRELVRNVGASCGAAGADLTGDDAAARTGLGSALFAVKPGDGSAREQAASSQKVLGGWANLAVEYATKRYRSNLVNWGMLPFVVSGEQAERLRVGDYLALPGIREAVARGMEDIPAMLVRDEGGELRAENFSLSLKNLTEDERNIILDGCLINYYNRLS
ncbi:MAG: hydratase [Desulfovibrio sp.]|nr:hydratase [Desulfovibrio sp.]